MNATARTADDAGRVLRGERRGSFRILPFLGPAFVACVAYIDPGNFATNIAGGSKFGYTLVWVIVAANLMAMLIQSLSAKLGIATGRNLPEVCRERFSRRTSLALWVQAEAIAMATDLAEFLGAAIGFHLLLDIAMTFAGLISGGLLVMAASAFFRTALVNVASLEGAHKTLEQLRGGGSKFFFALARLGSGRSGCAVGTMSGQVVMQGFIRRK